MQSKLKILVTAGPTREPIDPVRYITNYSTGKMGYALAKAAIPKFEEVFLVSGPSNLPAPEYVHFFPVSSAAEMKTAVLNLFSKVDVVIMAAAVADYRVSEIKEHKIKKEGKSDLVLTLVKNPDILSELGKKKEKQFLVGFAAESENLIDNALKKMQAKQLDMIIANNISEEGSGFAYDTNIATILNSDGTQYSLDKMPKEEMAQIIIDYILQRI